MSKRKHRADITIRFNTAAGLDLHQEYANFMAALSEQLHEDNMRILRGTRPRLDPKWTQPLRVGIRLESPSKINDLRVLAAIDGACHAMRCAEDTGEQDLSTHLSYSEGKDFIVTVKPSCTPALTI